MAERSVSLHERRTRNSDSVQNFDRVARIYRWAEYLSLGRLLQRTREHFLPRLLGTRQALVLGDGDGRFLARFLRCSPETQALAVDNSAGMLSLLQSRCSFAKARCRTLKADFNHLPVDFDLSQTDLVVTHFALDCLVDPDLERLVAFFARQLPFGALWLVSDFGIPARQPWRVLAQVYVRTLYLAFRLLTGLRTQRLPEVQNVLRRHGFRCLHRAEWRKGLLYSEIWQLQAPSSDDSGVSDRATYATHATSTLR